MDKIDIYKMVNEFYETLPAFEDGRINYSDSNVKPIITCFLMYDDEILLLKRSGAVGNDKNKWSTVTGYLDELCSIEDKAYSEVLEETGIPKDLVLSIHKGEVYEFTDDCTWIICPILLVLKEKPNVELNYEHVNYMWIKPDKMLNYDIVADLYNTFKMAGYDN